MISMKHIAKYSGDWLLCLGLQAYVALIGLRTKPFLREFNITDPSIQHPFTESEQVPNLLCLIIATVVPGTILGLHQLIQVKFDISRINNKQARLTHISVLGMALSVTITGFLIVIVKNWISRPRPDFIARCAPNLSLITKGKDTYTIDVCTGDYEVVLEGLRSTPSGHSALAFSGLHYITIWLFVQFDILNHGTHFWKLLLCSMPEWLALWVALSRTQDYRHHFGDVLMGGAIGIGMSHLVWRKLFKGKEPAYLEEEEISSLPLYSTVE